MAWYDGYILFDTIYKRKRGLHIKETPILYIYYRWMNSKDIYILGWKILHFPYYNEFYGSEIF